MAPEISLELWLGSKLEIQSSGAVWFDNVTVTKLASENYGETSENVALARQIAEESYASLSKTLMQTGNPKIVLKKVLQTDANAASCCMAWQGKVPEKLADFKTKKK